MTYLQKRLQLFSIPAFRWFMISSVLATFGAGLSYIAMTWLALHDNNSVSSVAILMISFWLPSVILGPFMGILVDSVISRHHLIAGSNLIRAVVLLIFGGFMLYSQSLYGLYLLSLILGTFFSVYMPAAFRLIREIVPEKDLLYANATIDMVYEIGNVVGMGSAGLFIALFKAPGAIIINGILFLISGLILFFIRRKDLTVSKKRETSFDIIGDFKSGLTYMCSNKILLILYTIQLLFFIEFLTAPVLLAPFAKNVLHTNVTQFSSLEASLSIGVIIGGILLPWLVDKFNAGFIVLLTTIILGISYIVFSYNHFISIAELLYFIIGLAFAIWPLVVTQAQNITDVNYQGRVQSCFNSISGLIILLIYLAVKLGSAYLSIQTFYWAEVIFTAIALILLWRYRKVLSY